MSCQIATTQPLLIQRIKSNLEAIIPAWDDLEWWDSLLPIDNNDSCHLTKEQIDAISVTDFDDLLKEEQDITPNSTLCKVETTTDNLDETSHLEWIDLSTQEKEILRLKIEHLDNSVPDDIDDDWFSQPQNVPLSFKLRLLRNLHKKIKQYVEEVELEHIQHAQDPNEDRITDYSSETDSS